VRIEKDSQIKDFHPGLAVFTSSPMSRPVQILPTSLARNDLAASMQKKAEEAETPQPPPEMKVPSLAQG
jgi:hypothetical protein